MLPSNFPLHCFLPSPHLPPTLTGDSGSCVQVIGVHTWAFQPLLQNTPEMFITRTGSASDLGTWDPVFTPSPPPPGLLLGIIPDVWNHPFPPGSALILTTYSSFARLKKRTTILWIWASEFLSSYFSLSLPPFLVKFLEGIACTCLFFSPPRVPPTAPFETALAEVSKALFIFKSNGNTSVCLFLYPLWPWITIHTTLSLRELVNSQILGRYIFIHERSLFLHLLFFS